MFDSDSRYRSLAHLTYTTGEGREILYKERRLVPPASAGRETTLAQGERLDLVAARTQGDPRLFWRICDVNSELNPFRLEERSGRVLKLPEQD